MKQSFLGFKNRVQKIPSFLFVSFGAVILVGIVIIFLRQQQNLQSEIAFLQQKNRILTESAQEAQQEKRDLYDRKLRDSTTVSTSNMSQFDLPPLIYPFLPKEEYDGTAGFRLSCGAETDFDTQPWAASLQKILEQNEQALNWCYNAELDVVVLFTDTVDTPSSIGSSLYRLRLFNVETNKIESVYWEQAIYLGGCGKILGWSKTGNVYFSCGEGDGPWASTREYRVQVDTMKTNATQLCRYFMDEKSCTSYCDSDKDCASGSFCNLQANNCVQSCREDKDCAGGFGSACYQFTDSQKGCW